MRLDRRKIFLSLRHFPGRHPLLTHERLARKCRAPRPNVAAASSIDVAQVSASALPIIAAPPSNSG